MPPEIFTTHAAKLWVREDGITHVVALPNLLEKLEDAKEIIATTSKINNGKRVPVLVDMRFGLGADRESRAYYSSQEGLLVTKALALLVGSSVTRVMANFFIGFNQPPVPTRLFTSEDEAVAWLKTFL